MEGVDEGSLGSSLEVRNRVFGGVVEYFICLKKFRAADVTARQAPSDPLMELVLLSPRRSLIFIRFSILFSIFISVMLLLPDLIIAKFDQFSCQNCFKILNTWLYVYRMVLLMQFSFRVLFYCIFSQLTNQENQEIIYCTSVITQGRGWSYSRKLTSFSYFWYGAGMILHRVPNVCNKRWLYAFIFYVLSANVLRFAFTVVLYYYTFPPSHGTARKITGYTSIVLPKISYKNALHLKSTCCGICLDDFAAEDMLRVLHCSHGFHTKCIDLWLSRSVVCPLCMKTLI
ncbi:Ring finger domain protein [Theileria parva strain Muguga]|uniref:RING-type domain-containing protein n=1 Tax=Theileria parva TaxID=5875 RepID=Q4N7X3_THEPA|nr:Ring finger domain protein [Theileria parva strain Muguga]EAN33935.1 Ring finger domain protein [Theileria parva strain Muguga]|eukprot:XP_766218.1 hypothetical protein [Theileria parva strain Muguga]